MKIPTVNDLSTIDPKVRFGYMQPDRPEDAFPSVMAEPHATYGVIDNGHLRTHSPYEFTYVQPVTNPNVKESDLEQRLTDPVSYTLRDRLNSRIFSGGRASVRARQPKAFVYDLEYAEALNPLGNEHFSGGNVAIPSRVAVAQYQYIGQAWEAPQRIQRASPESYSDQIPPAMLRQG
jgi:hypothetical protein